MPAAPGYSTRPFLTIRRGYLDVLDAGRRRRRLIHGLVEADVTQVRRAVSDAGLSFTAFIAWCVARAVVADPIVHAYRRGRRLILFDDVDINTQIEVEVDGQKAVQSLVLREVNRQGVAELTRLLRDARSDETVGRRRYRGSVAFFALPGFLRRLPFGAVMDNPILFRRFGGTVGLSAIGMFGGGGWAIPLTPTTLMVTVGGITRKPRYVDGQLAEREMLALTLTFDHTIVDGAPAARYADRLVRLIEAGPGQADRGARPA